MRATQVRAGRAGRRGGRGFTLIEVLVTIAVLIVMLPVIVQGFTIASEMARLTRQRAEATAIAQSKLDEMVATGLWQQGDNSGVENYRAIEYTWTVSQVPWEEVDLQPLASVSQLDVTVTWVFKDPTVKQTVTLSTVVYLPDETTAPATAATGGIVP